MGGMRTGIGPLRWEDPIGTWHKKQCWIAEGGELRGAGEDEQRAIRAYQMVVEMRRVGRMTHK